MRQLGLPELKQRQLAILRFVAGFCDERDIRYYLCAGTLLGAVRHQGYIPWDDDVDIMLPRPDYERFCAQFPQHAWQTGFSLHDLATSPAYPFPFAKVCDDTTVLDVESDVVRDIGVFVDVFPLDGWLPARGTRWLQARALDTLGQLMRVKHLQDNASRDALRNRVLRVAKLLTSPISVRTVSRMLTGIATASPFDESETVGVTVWGYREGLPRAAYGTPAAVVFEGTEYPGPEDSDTVLAGIYGDYMRLPPVEDRVTNHRFTAYVRDSG